MKEQDSFTPSPFDQTPSHKGLTQSSLEALYILGDPRGVAALSENIEYDVREISPHVQALLEQAPESTYPRHD